MKHKYGIRNYASIRNGRMEAGSELKSMQGALSLEDWLDEIYRSQKISYSKFHKMDLLSRLGFLTTEMLLDGTVPADKYAGDKTGIVLANRSSSLDTDIKYYQLLEKGIASPAVFVYTLPNILIGEICIRHKIKGESVFFISDTYNVQSQFSYIKNLLDSGVIDTCIAGWVELMGTGFESFLYLVGSDGENSIEEFSEESINKLYKSK